MTRPTRSADVLNASVRPPLPTAIRNGRVVAVGRALGNAGRVLAVAEALARGGVRAFEVTLNSEAALASVAAVARRYRAEEMLIGAGTVLDVPSAARAVDTGAAFLVTPVLDLDVVHWAVERGVPTIPGALSPTEMLAAWNAGASAVKLFPASAVGPSFVREMRGPLPQIPLIPTGGITVEDADDYLRAGAVAVAVGSWLTGGGDAASVERRARELVARIAEAA